MIEINYEEPDPGKDEYSQSFWRKSASLRERTFLALGVSEPYFYHGRWLERYSLLNPVTWMVWLISLLINTIVSASVAAAVTTHMMLLAERRLPKDQVRHWGDAPETSHNNVAAKHVD